MSESTTPGLPPRVKRFDRFLVLLLAGSLALNVYLGWCLKKSNNASAPPALKLTANDTVESFLASNLEGKFERIEFTSTGRPTVLYIFTPTCHWCARNKGNISALVQNSGDKFRFLGVSLAQNGLSEYVRKNSVGCPTYTNLTPDTINELGLGNTPQTIVVSSEGRVLKNWSGAYGGKMQREIEEYFQVTLPGLLPEGQ
jgi:hypothetical protein